MRINYNFFNYIIPSLKDKIIPELTDQQKRICSIASIVFALLAACYIGYCFFKKGESEDFDDSQDDSPLDGPGKITFLDGTVAEGEFTHGKLHGYGKKTLPDGTVEKGEFSNGRLNGDGTKTLPNGNAEEGQFKNGKLFKGKSTNSTRTAEGEFHPKYNWLHGQGKQEFNSIHREITKQEGQFYIGLLQGKGSQILSDGTEEEGIFNYDKLDGLGKRTWATGEVEEGNFQRGQLIKGKKIDAGGNIEEGEFKNDEIWTGKGKKNFTDRTYEGEFKNGKLHGKGQATYSDGTVKVGRFENGVFKG